MHASGRMVRKADRKGEAVGVPKLKPVKHLSDFVRGYGRTLGGMPVPKLKPVKHLSGFMG